MQVPQQVCQGNSVAQWDAELRRKMNSSSWKCNCSQSYHLRKLESVSLWHIDFWPEHRFLAWTLTGISPGHLSLQVPLSHCYNTLSVFFLFHRLEGGDQSPDVRDGGVTDWSRCKSGVMEPADSSAAACHRWMDWSAWTTALAGSVGGASLSDALVLVALHI